RVCFSAAVMNEISPIRNCNWTPTRYGQRRHFQGQKKTHSKVRFLRSGSFTDSNSYNTSCRSKEFSEFHALALDYLVSLFFVCQMRHLGTRRFGTAFVAGCTARGLHSFVMAVQFEI